MLFKDTGQNTFVQNQFILNFFFKRFHHKIAEIQFLKITFGHCTRLVYTVKRQWNILISIKAVFFLQDSSVNM